MISPNIIEKIKKRLVQTYDPTRIYIFGSYAWGNPNDESDLDLAVIVDEVIKDHYKALVAGHTALADLDLAKDIILLTQKEFDEKADNMSTLCYKIKHRGKKIYARA